MGSDDTLRKTNYLGSAKVTTYWDDVFELLVHYGYQIPRSFVGQLLESLLNQWKKPHLDWHCRLLKWLAPTQEELFGSSTNALCCFRHWGRQCSENRYGIHRLYCQCATV